VKKNAAVLLMLMLCLSVRAQVKDSVVHSPTKAWLMSAVVPGLGQAYNQRYWKIPVIYGGFIAFSYFIQTNNFRYEIYRNAYDAKYQIKNIGPQIAGLNTEDPYYKLRLWLLQAKQSELEYRLNVELKGQFENVPTDRLQYYKNSYRRDRDFFIIMTVLFYIVNMVDAAVDAHFFTYDVSNDLTLNWQPYMNNGIYASSQQLKPTVGLNFNITF